MEKYFEDPDSLRRKKLWGPSTRRPSPWTSRPSLRSAKDKGVQTMLDAVMMYLLLRMTWRASPEPTPTTSLWRWFAA